MLVIRTAIRALFAGALSLVAAASMVEAASLVVTQPPCVAQASRYCVRFENGFTGQVTLQQIKLVPPGAGKAIVSINGSGYCTNTSNARGAVWFESQIVAKADDLPAVPGPGGAIFAFTVDEISGNTPNATHAFNLSSQRVFTLSSAARKNYFFRVNVTRLDPQIFCDLYNMSMTVLFTD